MGSGCGSSRSLVEAAGGFLALRDSGWRRGGGQTRRRRKAAIALRELGLGEEEGVGFTARTRFVISFQNGGQAPGNVAAEAVDAEILHPVQEDVRLVVEEAGGVEVKLHDVGPVEAVRWV